MTRDLISKILYLLGAVILSAPAVSAAGLRFSGNDYEPIAENMSAGTGLEMLYVLWSTDGVEMIYQASSASATVEVAEFDRRGAAYATAVAAGDVTRSGAEVTVRNLKGDAGYVFTENGKPHYFWITDYARHMYNVNGLSVVEPRECDRLFLAVDGSAQRITYYTITGRSMELGRGLELSYRTLRWVADDFRYVDEMATETVESVTDGVINMPLPLVDTEVTLEGDRFLRRWGLEESVGTGMITCEGVACETSAEQQTRNNDNEAKNDTELGGSAPCEITFKAAVNDAAVFVEWQMSDSPEFEDVQLRFNTAEVTHVFDESGQTYVRFVCANASGTCETQSDVYTVAVGDSQLLCPNAFSPGASEGVNDEWKVSYKSIVSFECHIFNRWGTKMAELRDPSEGWDGKYGGKLVPPGVYYYVIKARGGDGKVYNLSGDINIVGFSH